MRAANVLGMLTATVLLFVIGVLGAFDVAVFHVGHARLVERDECQREAWIHVARGPVYAAQFVVIPNLRLAGEWAYALFALFAIDALVAALDVLEESSSRRAQGGLPRGEYFMHVVLSVLVGAMLSNALGAAWRWRTLPTSIALESHGPLALRVVLFAMAAMVLALALADAVRLVARALPPAKPVHVSVSLPANVKDVWDLTQDHRIHPAWDHRFDGIIMEDAEIRTGTRMRYEKSILGMTIRGWGRYKLHRPCVQSTFEFGSNDRRSLIRRGVGLWRYRALTGGCVEFSTSYTYEVRWGAFGALFDRWVFRPLFQRETERSFRRLARDFFAVARPRVLGAAGRKPARFEAAA